MKSACIVWRKDINIPFDENVNALLNELYLYGYAQQELCLLSEQDIEKTKRTLSAFKEENNKIFFIVRKDALLQARDCLQGLFREVQSKEGIFMDGQATVCLLCADCAEMGMEYLKKSCISYLQQADGACFERFTFKTVGASLAHVENLIDEAQKQGGDRVLCRHTRKYDEDRIQILYDARLPKPFTDGLLRAFAEGFGDTMYALDDVSLEEQLVFLLKLRGQKLSVAESFTGGGIARRIVSVPGASEVYFEGLNTYNEQAKIKRLGVSKDTLSLKGAVSVDTAYEMARGLLNTGDCDIAVATTGLAGPNTDSFGRPVGYCCIAVGTRERICVYQYNFDGNRKEITEKAINYALFLAYKRLKDII